jgi:hypothetical protein
MATIEDDNLQNKKREVQRKKWKKEEEKENKTKSKKRCQRKVQLVWLIRKLGLVG